MANARELIETAYNQVLDELPALAKLKLVLRLELPARHDVQIYRVEAPGPEITKVAPDDARLEISVPRARFNELVEAGTLAAWHKAYDRGDVKVSGDPNVVKLLGGVISKHESRAQHKRVR